MSTGGGSSLPNHVPPLFGFDNSTPLVIFLYAGIKQKLSSNNHLVEKNFPYFIFSDSFQKLKE